MKVYLPTLFKTYTILEDVEVSLAWTSRNLVLLRSLGYGGTKKVPSGYIVLYDEDGKALLDEHGNRKYETRYRNEASINPLYVKDSGKSVPVPVIIPAGTVFELKDYKYQPISGIWVKFKSSPMSEYKDRVAEINIKDFNQFDIDLVNV